MSLPLSVLSQSGPPKSVGGGGGSGGGGGRGGRGGGGGSYTTLQLVNIYYQSQKQSLYPRAPLKSLENPLMFGSSFCTKNLEIVNIGFLVKF